jgi:RHS repeat-associated protein
MSFDGCGNRLSLNGANDTFNVMNQSVNVGHDNEGNVQSYNGWIYTYDAHNRLRVANNPTIPSTTNFYYDGLNRQVARSTNGPAPSPTATPPPTPTPTPTATPTPTPTPPPNQCAPVTFSTTGRYPNTMKVTLSTTTSGATIFYTVKNIGTNVPPTHSGGTATGGTLIYSSPVNVVAGADKIFQAVAYKAGMTDSVITQFEADNTNPGGFAIIRGGVVSPMSPTLVTTTIYSVWDGDWALLEEYAPGNILTQKYVQGYHGLVKTLVDNIHYYQDSLGSTSHIADGNGNLLEWYKYNLYGAPTYWDASNTQTMTGSNYGVRDLFGGGRLVTEIGLYDNRNRFMSCDLGRFLQPDPIGFKGDGSNLYRYCNNNWGNKTDPLGTDALIVFEGYGTLTFHGGTKDTVGNVTLRNYAAAHGGVSIPRGNQGKALEIMASERAKDPTAFITTIGYSRGAIAANQTDREAGRRGITVNRQITIDPVTIEGGQAQLRVPPNVEEAENYHEHSSSWPPFQGGTLLNPNEHNHDYDLSGPGIDHNTIVKHALARSEAISMRTFGMLNLNGARGGGTAWGEQSNGSFVDSQGSSINLASDVDPAVEGAAARVPFSSW